MCFLLCDYKMRECYRSLCNRRCPGSSQLTTVDDAVYVQIEVFFLHLFVLFEDYVAQDFGVVVYSTHFELRLERVNHVRVFGLGLAGFVVFVSRDLFAPFVTDFLGGVRSFWG